MKLLLIVYLIVYIVDVEAIKILPPDLIKVAKKSNCNPITSEEFFLGFSYGKDPAYTYGVFKNKSSSAAFWCTKIIKGHKRLFLNITKDSSNLEAEKYLIDFFQNIDVFSFSDSEDATIVPGIELETITFPLKYFRFEDNKSKFVESKKFTKGPLLRIGIDGEYSYLYFYNNKWVFFHTH